MFACIANLAMGSSVLQPPLSGPSDPVWDALGLDEESLQSLRTELEPERLVPLLDAHASDAEALWNSALSDSVAAYKAESSSLPSLEHFTRTTLKELDDAADKLESLADTLCTAERSALDLRERSDECARTALATDVALSHLSAFIDQMFVDPALIRHLVDGKVGEPRYGACLSALSTKAALYEMDDVRSCTAYPEVKDVIEKLILTSVVRVRSFLVDKIALLKRPNTNVNIIKENVLLPHRALVEFVEQHAPHVFREVKNSYVETMSRTYYVLFKRYTAGLLNMKEILPCDSGDTLVGSLDTERATIWRKDRVVKAAGVSQFALGDRLKVLRDVEGPAIVLATAVDNNERFFYEQIHRSLGKMLSETCASEHMFCEHFFGEGGGRLFDVFFRRIVGFLLDAVKTHTEPTRDTVGVLLALKVNEAQRSSMQKRNIMDLSDFFIQVDIILKPKFKKLFDENILSVSNATTIISRSSSRSDSDAGPHIVTRRFGEFVSSLLAIARFGTPDDSTLEGLRRLRSEYNGFLNTFAGLFASPKLRYVFLVNNVDFVLSMLKRNDVVATEEYHSFSELQEVHMAAYVEHEVADHFPDIVSFVRQFERATKAAGSNHGGDRQRHASEERVKAVLRQFASNWRLGVSHMQDSVLREFPNYELGMELTKSLFSRLLTYHKRCEAAISSRFPKLENDVVATSELVSELRQRTNKM